MRVTFAYNFNPARATSSALRVRGIAEGLSRAGCDVTFVGPANPGSPFAWPGNDSIPIHAGGAVAKSLRSLIIDQPVSDALDSSTSDALLVYGTTAGLLRAAYRQARSRGIPVVLDVVEWYQSSHMIGGRLGPWALANSDSMRRLSAKADRVIAISSTLASHYQALGLETLIVPPLFSSSIRDGLAAPPSDGNLHLCFAGSLGGKDSHSLANTLAAARSLGGIAGRLRFHLIGPTREELCVALGGRAALPPNVIVHGRLPHEEALQLVASSHYTVLQRPEDARYAQAGFPSKVAESLVLGTPVISNLTSDLGKHLVDGKNAIVLGGDTLDDMIDGLNRALHDQLDWARSQIQFRADADFNPSVFAEALADFVSQPRRRRP